VGLRGVFTDMTAQREIRQQREREAVVSERQRLARDLHDSVSQTLYSIAAIAEALPRLSERQPEVERQGLQDLRRLASGALAEMRTLLLELRPVAIVEEPLDKLLGQLVNAGRAHTQATINLTLTGECAIPPEVQLTLYRIAQEGLNNAVRHAHADQIRLGLYCQHGRVTLGVSDTGQGFDAEQVAAGHFGLSIMRERAEGIGAEFALETEPGEGTEILVVWRDLDVHSG
jgi:signal transduction histidine kinase